MIEPSINKHINHHNHIIIAAKVKDTTRKTIKKKLSAALGRLIAHTSKTTAVF